MSGSQGRIHSKSISVFSILDASDPFVIPSSLAGIIGSVMILNGLQQPPLGCEGER